MGHRHSWITPFRAAARTRGGALCFSITTRSRGGCLRRSEAAGFRQSRGVSLIVQPRPVLSPPPDLQPAVLPPEVQTWSKAMPVAEPHDVRFAFEALRNDAQSFAGYPLTSLNQLLLPGDLMSESCLLPRTVCSAASPTSEVDGSDVIGIVDC